MRLPASSRTTSPTTRSLAGISSTLPAAPHPDDRGGQLAQGLHGLLGLVFLAEAQDRIEDEDGEDGDGVLVVAQERGGDRGEDEDDDEEGGELLQEDAPGALDVRLGQFVGAVLGQPAGRLFGAEAVARSGARLGQGLIGGDAIPVGQ